MWSWATAATTLTLAALGGCEIGGGQFLTVSVAKFSWDRKDKQGLSDTSETICALACFLSPNGCSFYSFNAPTKECSFRVNNAEGNSVAVVITDDDQTKTTLHARGRKTVKGDAL